MPSLPAPAEIRKAFSLPGLFDASSHRSGDGRLDVFGLMQVAGRPVQVCVTARNVDSRGGAPTVAGVHLDWWPVRRRDQSDESVRRTAADVLGALGSGLEGTGWLPPVLGRSRRPVRNWTFEMTRRDDSIPSGLLEAVNGPDDLDIYVQLRSNCCLKCRFCPSSSPPYGPIDQDGDLDLVASLVERVIRPARQAGVSTSLSIDADDVAAHRHLPAIMELIHESCGCPVHLVVPAVRLSSPAVVAAMARLPGLFKLSTSLFGASAATHDAVAGLPGAFAATVRALRNLSGFPTWVQGHFVMTRDSVGEVGAVVDILGHFGIDVMIQGLLADCASHEPLLRTVLPDLASVRAAFEESGAGILGASRAVGIEIVDFPPCAVVRELRGLTASYHPRSGLYRHILGDGCAACVHSAGCIGVSAVYFEVHGNSGMNPESD